MNEDEQKLINKLQHWKVGFPPAYLADTIVRHAIRQVQYQPWTIRAVQSLEAAFTQWNYGLSYKLASLVICAVLGFSGGNIIVENEQDDSLSQATSVAFSDEEWTGL